MKRQSRSRRDFLKQAAVASAAGVAWIYGGDLAFGQIPWEQELETVAITDTDDVGVDDRAELGSGLRTGHPRIAFDKDEQLWATWVDERDGIDCVFLTHFDGRKFAEEIPVSDGKRHATHPRIVAVGDGIAIAWAEKDKSGWSIKLRTFTGGKADGAEETLVEDAPAAWRPAMASDGDGNVLLAWEQLAPNANDRDRFAIGHATGKPGSLRARIYKVDDRELSRPAVTFDKKGRGWLAWDRDVAPGSRQVFLSQLEEGELGEIVQVTYHPAASIAPSIAPDGDGNIWIAYQSNRRGMDEWDIPRWIYTTRYDGRRFHEPTSPPLAMNLDKEGTDQSFEFPTILCAPDGRVIVTGRPSHNWCVQQYHGNEWSPLYRVPVDGWGGRGKYMDAALDSEGNLWVARRDIRACMLHRVTGLQREDASPDLKRSAEQDYAGLPLVNIIKAPDRWPALTELSNHDGDLNIYYGDIHGHTWTSDGVGDIDEWYHTRRDYYQDDFASLTDHDSFVGQNISETDFELQKGITQQFNEPGKFVTLFGQEWTTGRYPVHAGHKCIYTTNPDVPLFNHSREEYRTTKRLYPELKKWGCIIIPHHTGWTGTDWENFDPEVQVATEIVSNHGRFEYMGNRPIPHRGGNRGCFLQDGLAMGHRFGIIGGSDGHGLIWHHSVGWKRDCNRTGLACVLAPELTRESIFDAIRNRRVFASSGNKPRLDFRVNESLMGSEIETSEGQVTIRADVSARENLKWLSVIKNNKVWYEFGGENFRSRFTVKDEDLEPGTSYYYLRVEFQDGNMAWSSPIWVTRT